MKTQLRIGYFAHWSQPPYKFVDFMREQGFEAKKIDYSRPGYLEKFDVVLIEQQGFNDYIENDELYIRDWVKRGGVCLFIHQDYCRWPGAISTDLSGAKFRGTIRTPGVSFQGKGVVRSGDSRRGAG